VSSRAKSEVVSKKASWGLGASFLVLAAVLFAWQLLCQLGGYEPSVFPGPGNVLQALMESANEGKLWVHILRSLWRVTLGFGLAVLVGIPAGLVLGFYGALKRALDPLLQILRPISPIAWIPLAVLWFGLGDRPAVFIIFMAAVFPVLVSSSAAVGNLDPVLARVALNFETGGGGMLWKVILPSALPLIMVGMRIALGTSWLIIVAAEMTGMRSGLGFLILDARNFLRTDLIIAAMIVVGVIGLVLDRSFLALEALIKRRWQYPEFKGAR
jgi:NitT/TauT family transport system permease protein